VGVEGRFDMKLPEIKGHHNFSLIISSVIRKSSSIRIFVVAKWHILWY
jgi:hypothetical protein